MSTRCLFGFKKDEETKLMYNHSDGYPSHAGRIITEFILQNKTKLDKISKKLELFKYNDFLTPHAVNFINTKTSYAVQDYYKWSQLAYFIDIQETLRLLSKGLHHCVGSSYGVGEEYIYIIDLDTSELKVYKTDVSSKTPMVVIPFSELSLDWIKEYR